MENNDPLVTIAKAREEFLAAAREVVEINREHMESQGADDLARLVAAGERLAAAQQKLMAAEAAGPQPTYEPLPLTGPVKRKLRRTFACKDRAEATALLERECGRNIPFNGPTNLPVIEQVRLAIIELSGGDLSEVRRQIAVAKEDWRDVLILLEPPGNLPLKMPGR